jgi:hypothetical protein
VDEIDFVYEGEQMHWTRQQVIDAMRHQVPERIGEWALVSTSAILEAEQG